MSDITINQFSKSVEALLSNPSRAQQFSLGMLERVTGGEEVIIDATNPFVFLLEAATANASANLNKTEALVRRSRLLWLPITMICIITWRTLIT